MDAALLTVLGTGAVAIVGWFWAMLLSLKKRIDETYTKEETKEIVDLKLQPLINAVDSNTRVNERLVEVVNDLRMSLAEKQDK